MFVFYHNVNFVLQHNDVFELHNIYSDQMLTSLRLWVRLVTSNEEKCSIHDCSSSEHGSHQSIVAWAIDKTNMAGKHHFRRTPFIGAFHIISLRRAV